MEHESVLNNSISKSYFYAGIGTAVMAPTTIIVAEVLVMCNNYRLRQAFLKLTEAGKTGLVRLQIFEAYFAEVYPYFGAKELRLMIPLQKWEFFLNQDSKTAVDFYTHLNGITDIEQLKDPNLVKQLANDFKPEYLIAFEQAGGSVQEIKEGIVYLNRVFNMPEYIDFLDIFYKAVLQFNPYLDKQFITHICILLKSGRYGTVVRQYPNFFSSFTKLIKDYVPLNPDLTFYDENTTNQMLRCISNSGIMPEIEEGVKCHRNYHLLSAGGVDNIQLAGTVRATEEETAKTLLIPSTVDTASTFSSFNHVIVQEHAINNPSREFTVFYDVNKGLILKNKPLVNTEAAEFCALRAKALTVEIRGRVALVLIAVFLIIATLVLFIISSWTNG